MAAMTLWLVSPLPSQHDDHDHGDRREFDSPGQEERLLLRAYANINRQLVRDPEPNPDRVAAIGLLSTDLSPKERLCIAEAADAEYVKEDFGPHIMGPDGCEECRRVFENLTQRKLVEKPAEISQASLSWCRKGDAIVWNEYSTFRRDLAPEDCQQAMAHFEQALQVSPGNSKAWHGLGLCYKSLRNAARAAQCLKMALEYAPTSPHIINSIGTLYDDKKQYEFARILYTYALEADKEDAAAWGNLGSLYPNNQRVTRTYAMHCLRKAIEHDNDPTWRKEWSDRLGRLAREGGDG